MTVICSELPLRPRPEPGEALLGYLLRLSYTNGYQMVETLRKLFGLKNCLLHSINKDHFTAQAVFDVLGERVRLSADELKAHFKDSTDVIYRSQAIQNISLSRPYVCLVCMREGKPIQASWRLAHVTHCIVHETELVHCCPKCDHELKWKPSLYSHCDACDITWQDIVVATSPVPTYQRVEETLSKPRIQVYRHHLYHVACMVMRFFDMQLAESQTFPIDIARLTMLFSFSYRFLVDSEFRKAQLDKRIAYWISQGELRHLPMCFFDKLHRNFHHSVTFLPETREEYHDECQLSQCQTQRIIRPRQALLKDKTSAHFQMDVGTLAQCLDLKIADITPMAKNGVIASRNDPKLVRDYWFDVRDVETLFTRLMELANLKTDVDTTPELIPIEQAIQIVRRSKWRLADILKLVVEKQCAVYLKKKTQSLRWQALYIDREMLFNVLDFSFFDQQSPLNSNYLKQYFYTNGIRIERLVYFIQQQNSGSRSYNSVSVGQLNTIVENFLLLNRWCRLRKLSIPKVLNLLTEANIKPVFNYGATNGFYVFEKTEVLKPILNKAILSGHCTTAKF